MTELVDLYGLPGFVYVATPYTNYAYGHNSAAGLAADAADTLMKLGHKAFSPIAHSHAVGGPPNEDVEWWDAYNKPFVDAAAACVVVKLQGWDTSRGVQHEIAEFTKAGKPIVYLAPGDIW